MAGSIGIKIGSFAPRGVEGGSFSRGFSGFSKIGRVGPPVNEGPISKAALGISGVEVKFQPHRLNPVSAPKIPSILAQTRLLNRQEINPFSPEAQPANLPGFTAWRPENRRVTQTRAKVDETPRPVILVSTVGTASKHIEAKLAQVRAVIAEAVKPALTVKTFPLLTEVVSQKPKNLVLVQPEEKEEEVTEKIIKIKPKEGLKEEEVVDKKRGVEDIEVSAQRKREVRVAVVKARAEALKLGLEKITGWMVAKFLPAEHMGNRSGVVKEAGPDGSYQETVEEIARTGELESETQAVSRFDAVISEKKPVKYDKNGIPVRSEDLIRVFKYRIMKPSQVAYEQVVKRVVKKGWNSIELTQSFQKSKIQKLSQV